MTADAGRAREEALGYAYDENGPAPSHSMTEDVATHFEAGYIRAIAAAVEVVEGHRCRVMNADPSGDYLAIEKNAHPGQSCAAAIAAELKRLM